MAGKANFAMIQKKIRNDTNVHINKPNSGVSNFIKTLRSPYPLNGYLRSYVF
jgi:hypothetical protein